MKKIAITGNIACGKSCAYKFIKDNNYSIIDCDNTVNELYTNKKFKDKIALLFPEIINEGKIDKKALCEKILNNTKFKKQFEAFIFPIVKIEINNFFKLHKDAEKVFVVVPLLFEAKMEDMFDFVIMISADENIRTKRLKSRSTIMSENAEKIIKLQMPECKKIKKSDFIIKNNGTIEEFKTNFEKLVRML